MQENRLWNKNGSSAKITWQDWFKLDCLTLLTLIPIVGPLLLLGIYIFLLVNNETAYSIRSRIKANLIWTIICLAIGVVAFLVTLSLSVSLGNLLS